MFYEAAPPTGPCIPLHVQSFTQCENNVGTVSWAQSDGAEYYTAIAVAQDGHTHMCNTNDSACIWDDLHCGESYTVQVVANDYMCSSAPSNSTSIRMGTVTASQIHTGVSICRSIFTFYESFTLKKIPWNSNYNMSFW